MNNAKLNALTLSINEQTARQVEVAKNAIGLNEAIRECINRRDLGSLPHIVGGEFDITYKDSRGEPAVKTQDKNTLFWLIAITLLTRLDSDAEIIQPAHSLNTSGLTKAFQNWTLENMHKEWDDKSARLVAQAYINSMRGSFLKSEATTMPYVNKDGKKSYMSFYMISDVFRDELNTIVQELRDEAKMKFCLFTKQPADWISNLSGIGEFNNHTLIKNDSREFVAPSVLNAVNKLQAVCFTIPECMFEAAQDELDNLGSGDAEYARLLTAILTYEGKADNIFFGITLDKRGRMYYRGGVLSPQGQDFCKASFQFKESVALGEEGYTGLAIHSANVLGQDKLSINGRIKFYNASHDKMMAVEYPEDVESFKGADKFQGYMACKEYQKLHAHKMQGGSIETFESTLVSHQDGTCNGIQHSSAITNDRSTAIAVNCTASSWDDLPSDIYKMVADHAISQLKGKAQEFAQLASRSGSKNTVMIVGYGAGEETCVSNTVKYFKEKYPTINDADARAIGEAYYNSCGVVAPAIKKLTNALKSRAKKFIEAGNDTITWTTQDGFVVEIKYTDIEAKRFRAGTYNALVKGAVVLDTIKTVGALSPNFVHSIDATHLRNVVNGCDWSLVTVHDSIGSHAANFLKTARVIREQFVATHDYNALEQLVESMGARRCRFRADEFYSAEEALQSSYIFS